MDIYTVIKQDHDEARGVMEKIMRARSPERREALVAELRHAILMHAETEEATWYAALRQFPEMEDKMAHAREEHDVVEELLDSIVRLAGDQDKFLIEFGEIKMGLEHHMHEEENELFPKSRELISPRQARELGEQMRALEDDYVDRNMLAISAINYLNRAAYN